MVHLLLSLTFKLIMSMSYISRVRPTYGQGVHMVCVITHYAPDTNSLCFWGNRYLTRSMPQIPFFPAKAISEKKESSK